MMKKFLVGVLALVVVAGAFMMWRMMQPPPDDLDLNTTRTSAKGLYEVTFVPEKGVPSVGPISVWLVKIKDREGKPVTDAKVEVDGGMPQHGHGLPTKPAAIGETDDGVYRIDGVKFSMSGWWEFRLQIDAAPGKDSVTFNTILD